MPSDWYEPLELKERLAQMTNEKIANRYLVPIDDLKRIANGRRVKGLPPERYEEIQARLRLRDRLRSRLEKSLGGFESGTDT